MDNLPWFTFSLEKLSPVFFRILAEGLPFLFFGTLISGLVDQFLPVRSMARLLPRNAYIGACLSGLMGLVFPMCKLAVVPVMRRLVSKGLPVSHAITYMLASPIVNPIVASSTYAAFCDKSPVEMTCMRLGLGYFIAIVAGLAVHNLQLSWVLRQRVLNTSALMGGGKGAVPATGGVPYRVGAALLVAIREFLHAAIYFVAGAAVAAVVSTSLSESALLPFASRDWLAVGSMMFLSAVLSLCSTSDAFVAAAFGAFPISARLAFLVFGPMIDIKMLFIYSSVFRARFVAGLALGLFLLIGLVCARLQVIRL